MSKKIQIGNYAKLGLAEEAMIAKQRNIFGELTFVWWGQSQWYKWRWNDTHADFGWFSIYGIKRPKLWLPVKWLMKPMRLYYHKKYVHTPKKLKENR
jgi:hypothetical protein